MVNQPAMGSRGTLNGSNLDRVPATDINDTDGDNSFSVPSGSPSVSGISGLTVDGHRPTVHPNCPLPGVDDGARTDFNLLK
jgi:hypothetical protein